MVCTQHELVLEKGDKMSAPQTLILNDTDNIAVAMRKISQ